MGHLSKSGNEIESDNEQKYESSLNHGYSLDSHPVSYPPRLPCQGTPAPV